MKHVVFIATLLSAATAQAAVSFGPAGTGFITFDTLPAGNQWSTLPIMGSASHLFTEAALDAAVQTNTSTSFVDLQLIDSAISPTPHPVASWSSTRLAVCTGPAGVAAQMLMATLRNDSGATIQAFQIVYDFLGAPGTVERGGGRELFPAQHHVGLGHRFPKLRSGKWWRAASRQDASRSRNRTWLSQMAIFSARTTFSPPGNSPGLMLNSLSRKKVTKNVRCAD